MTRSLRARLGAVPMLGAALSFSGVPLAPVFTTAAPLAGAAVVLAGCSVFSKNTVNGVTTITVNVAQLDAYSKAITSGAKTLLSNPLIASAMPPTTATVALNLVTLIQVAVSKVDQQANGSQTLTFNANNVPASIASIEADVSTLFGDISTGFAAAGSAVGTTATQVFNAFETVVALVQAVIPAVSVAKAPRYVAVKKMPATQALAILNAPAAQ